MKTVKLIRAGGFRLAIMSMFVLFAFTGCSAHPNNASNSGSPLQTETDSVMRSAIGESLYKIIIGAKSVKAEEIILKSDPVDSVATTTVNVKSRFLPLVQFIVADPNNYCGNKTVFGKFMPCFKLTFVKKKEVCVLNFDFGLKKWNICDGNGKVIRSYDLSSDDMLRLANMLFPDNELFKNLINSNK
jgi:hypothetical protein